MADIPATLVKELRERTGAGLMDCKRALAETGGDLDRAATYLREKGLAAAAKKAGRLASEGIVDAYIHAGGRIGVLIEVNCETDFVARNEAFRALVHELALQVAAANPRYVRREDVPEEVLAEERRILTAQVAESGKPPEIVAKIVTGRLEKFFEEQCLLEQVSIRDPKEKVGDLVKQAIARLGENIQVRRFVRFQLGEGLPEPGCSVEEDVQEALSTR
jgi:elongation factor Ts